MDKIKILIVGCGHMGASHALGCHELEGFEIVGLVSRGDSNQQLNETLHTQYPLYNDYYEALKAANPDAVCISTYQDTHEQYALAAFEKGCDVFIEKPLADSVEGAQRVVQAAKKANKKLVVGYILRHHPSWVRLTQLAQGLGKPLVMRMNLNQQSSGHAWEVHKKFLENVSPIVDCGVHYLDVMCQMTRSKPVKVHAIGVRLSDEVKADNYNYGQLQISFEDGSVGWYEVGWGPMISETAYFIKDVIGPKGSVSIAAKNASSAGQSSNIDSHTKTESILVHHSGLTVSGEFEKKDEWLDMSDEPDHNVLCKIEQSYFYKAITENIDLTEHMEDALNSLRIAFAADESVKTGKVVYL